MSGAEKEDIFKTGIEIGEIVGKYGTPKQIKLFEKMIEDYKNKGNECLNLKKEIKLMKSVNINENFISKDKIRNEIKELENILEKRKTIDIIEEINRLEELLGDDINEN